MDLNEAIQHCLEIASEEGTSQQCKDDHLQLAEWLIELKVRREIQMPPLYSLSPPTEQIKVSIPPFETISNKSYNNQFN